MKNSVLALVVCFLLFFFIADLVLAEWQIQFDAEANRVLHLGGQTRRGHFATREQCQAYWVSQPGFERQHSRCVGYDTPSSTPWGTTAPARGLSSSEQMAMGIFGSLFSGLMQEVMAPPPQLDTSYQQQLRKQQQEAEAARIKQKELERQEALRQWREFQDKETSERAMERAEKEKRSRELLAKIQILGSDEPLRMESMAGGKLEAFSWERPKAQDLRERWLAELSTLRAEVRHIQEVLGRLDKSMQNDQQQRKDWEKTTSEAYARALDAAKSLIMDLAVDLPDGYFNDKLQGAITLKERERFERALRLVQQLKKLRNVKDFAAWASNKEFGREEVIDGVKMIAGILLQDEKLAAKLALKNVLIIKTAAERIINSSYDITAEVLSWRAINQLNKNSQAYLDAVKALSTRMIQVVKRINELKDKLEAIEEARK